MVDNIDNDDIEIELPNKLDEVRNEMRAQSRKRRPILKFFLYLFISIFIILFVLISYAKIRYNDDYIREHINSVLTKNTNIVIKTESFSTNWYDVSCVLSNLKIYSVDNQTQKEVGSLRTAHLKINLIKTIMDKSLSIDVLIDNFELNVSRIKINDKLSGKEKYTTNITEILNNIILLPWKVWLSDINWRTASGAITITDGLINATDEEGVLEDFKISDIDIKLSRDNDFINSSISMKSVTPKSELGAFYLELNAVLAELGTHNNASNIAFLKNIGVTSKAEKFDAPYMLRYFGWNKITLRNTTVELVEPLSLDLDITSETMEDVKLQAELYSKSIGKVTTKNKSLLNTPPIRVSVDCVLDFSHLWTEIKPLDIELGFGDEATNLLKVSSQVNGSFGNEFVVTMSASTDLTAFTKSPLGKHLDSNLYGVINHTFAGNWKKDGIWKLNYALSGDDVTGVIDGQTISLPVDGNINCLITKSKLLTPLEGVFDLNFKSRAFGFKTIKPLEVDFTNKNSNLLTSIEFYADFAKLHDTHSKIFSDLNIGKIDEIISGTITADSDGNTKWDVVSSSKHTSLSQNDIRITGNLVKSADDEYKLDTSIMNQGKLLNFNIGGELKKKSNIWKLALVQSGVLDVPALHETYSRFNNLIIGKQLPFNASGSVREAINATVKFADIGNFSLAMSMRAELENIKTTIRQEIIDEKNIKISTSIGFRKAHDKSLLTINNLNLSTKNSNIQIKAGEYDLNLTKKLKWRDILRSLPVISGDVSVDSNDMTKIGRIIQNRIANLFFRNAAVKSVFSTQGGAKATLSKFDYTAELINVKANKEFDIEPIKMTDQIIAKKWFGIQKSLSDVDLTVWADMKAWGSFVPKIAIDIAGVFSFDAAYIQDQDKLSVRRFETIPVDRDELLIPSIKFDGAVVDFFQTISSFGIIKFMNSIDERLHIDYADISTAQLKLLAGNDPGSNMRALQGKNISLTDVTALHDINTPHITITGNLQSKTSYFSKSYTWPLLTMDGTISSYSNPLILRLGSDSIAVKGAFDLTKSNVEFNALSPYMYKKPPSEPLKLDFSAEMNYNDESSVEYANLVGGPLAVTLNGFTHKPIGERYKLTLDSVYIDGPLTGSIKNLLLDSSADLLNADISVAPFDLAGIQQSINYHFPINLEGTLGSLSIQLDDNYWKFFSATGANVQTTKTPHNSIGIGATNIKISSNLSSEDSVIMAFTGGHGDESTNSVVLNNVTIDNPKGYSNVKAVDAELVSISPDLQTLFSDQIIIDRIDIDGLKAFYEVAFKKSNIDALSENVGNIFSNDNAASGTSKKTLIRNLYVNNGVVRISSVLLKGSPGIPIPLNLHLENIGGDNVGSTFASGFGKIFSSIGKVSLGVLGGVGGVISEVGHVGKAIITAPFKLFKKNNDKNAQE